MRDWKRNWPCHWVPRNAQNTLNEPSWWYGVVENWCVLFGPMGVPRVHFSDACRVGAMVIVFIGSGLVPFSHFGVGDGTWNGLAGIGWIHSSNIYGGAGGGSESNQPRALNGSSDSLFSAKMAGSDKIWKMEKGEPKKKSGQRSDSWRLMMDGGNAHQHMHSKAKPQDTTASFIS